MSALRIAIIGAGPKGTSALERLIARGVDGEVVVDVYEPHPFPGAGPVYDPRQPDYLRMNVASGLIDAWRADDRVPDDDAHPSFATWSRSQPGDMTFPPRAVVGRYLVEAFARIVADAPVGMRVRVLHCRVVDVARSSERWQVVAVAAAGDGSGARHTDTYDEVLVATGHAAEWRGAMDAATCRVFPIEDELAPDRVPAGAHLAMRGCALTCIDAALALTQGRGGSFEPDGVHPWRLRYTPGADQVARITPFSRTGLVMLAKPVPGRVTHDEDLRMRSARAQQHLLEASDHTLVDALESALDDVARAVAGAMAPEDPAPSPFVEEADTPIGQLVQSLDIGHGLQAQPTAAWASGHAWRLLYPTIVTRVRAATLSPARWDGFASIAARQERRAFGPPPVNAAKLVALVDAGVVDLDHLDDEAAARADAAIVVDAVLPAPGARDVDVPVLASALAAGHARVQQGRRGIEVCDDGTCIDTNGSPTRGLAVIGRPTEDSIVGNDTLDRGLHDIADRWAIRVARLTRHGATR